MDNLSVLGAGGMRARLQSLELLANNMANTETGGYKADREFYSLYASLDASPDPVTGETPTLPVIENHWTDLTQGSLRVTDNPLDLAVDGKGLFAVITPRGVRYTRNGSFKLAADGAMTTLDGSPLRSRAGVKIVLQRDVPFEVLPDGTVNQAGAAAGRLDLISFDPTSLTKEGANYFAPAAGASKKEADGKILQGKLEGSNAAPAESAVKLVEIMRQFESLQKAILIGNEINKRAMDEVARVTQ
ncbi:MAG: flagellar hook basal-body protein [Terriglobia bacterium]